MRKIFCLLFLICPICSFANDKIKQIDISKVISASRQTKYGQNIEHAVKKEIKPIIKYLPSELIGVTSVIIKREFEFEIINNNSLKYNHRDKRFSYQFNYNF